MWLGRKREHNTAGQSEVPGAREVPDVGDAAAPQSEPEAQPAPASADDFLSALPPGCAGIIFEGTRRHTRPLLSDDWGHSQPIASSYADQPRPRSQAATSSEFVPELTMIQTYSSLLDCFDEKLSSLRGALAQSPDSWIGQVAVHDHRPLARILDGAGVPWTAHSRSFVDFLTDAPTASSHLLDALRQDIQTAAAAERDAATALLPALTGGMPVYQRDTLTVDKSAHSYEIKELLILGNRGLILATSSARLTSTRGTPRGSSHTVEDFGLTQGLRIESEHSVEDLGLPQSIRVRGDQVVVTTTKTNEREVSVTHKGARHVTGYKTVPMELTLRDPVSAAVLVALVELGCGSVLEDALGNF